MARPERIDHAEDEEVWDGTTRPGRPTATTKVELIIDVLSSLVVVRLGLRRRPLPDLVERMGRRSGVRRCETSPPRLGRIVYRVLNVGPFRPRCLTMSLVLYRLLLRAGVPAQLVLGLPNKPEDKDAHAWVEVGGIDVGPPPGRGTHAELARYG